jgi:hypothetical protein
MLRDAENFAADLARQTNLVRSLIMQRTSGHIGFGLSFFVAHAFAPESRLHIAFFTSCNASNCSKSSGDFMRTHGLIVD